MNSVDLAPRRSSATPEFLELVGSNRASIEAYAICDLCVDLDEIDGRLRQGAVDELEYEALRAAALARNAAVWGAYACAPRNGSLRDGA